MKYHQQDKKKELEAMRRFLFLLWSDKKKRKEERCFPVAGKELSTLRADLQTAYVILKSDLCYGS